MANKFQVTWSYYFLTYLDYGQENVNLLTHQELDVAIHLVDRFESHQPFFMIAACRPCDIKVHLK